LDKIEIYNIGVRDLRSMKSPFDDIDLWKI